MRVLVVEDHEQLAEIVATGLRGEGMAVDVALDGAAALEKAAVHRYDVVVLDRDLPDLHGDDVCWNPALLADARERYLPGMSDEQIIARLDALTQRLGGFVIGFRGKG